MKPQPNSEPSSRQTPAVGAANAGGSPATVPLSVYRELSAELQASKAMLDSLNTQNQQLTRQNQQFRHEIERLMQVSINLQQIAGLPQPNWGRPPEMLQSPPSMDTLAAQLRQPNPPRPQVQPAAARPIEPPPQPTIAESQPPIEDLFATEETPVQRISSQPQVKRDLTGLWLWLTVFVIIVTAFGAGFMVVRPLLPKR